MRVTPHAPRLASRRQATDGDYIWEPVKDGGFLANGEVSPDHRHGGKNGFDDRPFVEYLIELK